MIGAADALEQAGDALGGADLDDLVDAAPVDAEVERGGGDDGAELAGGHGGFDLAALGDVEAAVVDGDGEGVVVQLPQGLEHEFALGAGVDEDDGHGVGADALEDAGGGGEAHVAGPGQAFLGEHDGEGGRGAFGDFDELGVATEPVEEGALVGDGGGEADAAQGGDDGAEAGEAEGELVAALGAGEGVTSSTMMVRRPAKKMGASDWRGGGRGSRGW